MVKEMGNKDIIFIQSVIMDYIIFHKIL